MTSEQIAELRETLRAENTPVWGVTDGKTVTWTTTPDVSEKITLALRRWLPRLLDEREALLNAAKYLVENYPERQATRYMIALKHAIVKAESP